MVWPDSLLLLLLLLHQSGLCMSGADQQVVSVVRDNQGGWQVVPGKSDSWIVVANLTNTVNQNGWLQLDITSNEVEADQVQAEAAGVAEGFLTRDLIYSYYKEFIHQDFCRVEQEFCDFTVRNFEENNAWISGKLESQEGEKPHWKMTDLFYKQLEGLKQGWLLRTKNDNLEIPADFDADWFAYFINFYPDIGDYIHQYKKIRTKQPRDIRSAAPSCSVLIKRLPDGDILIGHATWHEYRAMSYRILKRYNLNYHMGDVLVPGHTISMTSYAGTVFSLDDFYSLSSGLSTLETTLFVYNKDLYDQNTPTGQLWEPVRVMVANRLAATGKEWVEVFSEHNSGTYNNQWMVVDYNKARRQSETGVLWVLEQLPGDIISRDMTRHLLDTSYWASYNRAYFLDTFVQSGGQEMARIYGDWFSYDRNPRAQLFKDQQDTIQDEESMLRLLRSNSYQTSQHSTPPGCSGSIPSAAVAARADLQSVNTTCIWEKEDFMVGHRAYGAIDAKVMTSSSSQILGFSVVAGPTSQGSLPPFSWSSSGFPPPDFAPVDTFVFEPFKLIWNGGYSSRSVFEEEEEEEEEEGSEVTLNSGGLKLNHLENNFGIMLPAFTIVMCLRA